MWQSPQLSSARAKLTISWSTSAGMGHPLPLHPGSGGVAGVVTSGLVTQCVMQLLLSTDDPTQSFLGSTHPSDLPNTHPSDLPTLSGWIQSLVLIWDPSPMPGLPQVALQDDQEDQDDHFDWLIGGLGPSSNSSSSSSSNCKWRECWKIHTNNLSLMVFTCM